MPAGVGRGEGPEAAAVVAAEIAAGEVGVVGVEVATAADG
jgi:hypothetical protein